MAVKAMLQRVSESTGIAVFWSNIGKVRAAVRLHAAVAGGRGVAAQAVEASSPPASVWHLRVAEAQEKKQDVRKVEDRKKVDQFLALVKKVGFGGRSSCRGWSVSQNAAKGGGMQPADFEEKKKRWGEPAKGEERGREGSTSRSPYPSGGFPAEQSALWARRGPARTLK